MQQIFYVTIDPEKALGVEDLIPSYHILYSENSQLAIPIADNGVDIHNFPRSNDVKLDSTAKMLQNSKLISYIRERSYGRPNILVFKNDDSIEKECKKNNFKLLNPSSTLNKRFENKVELAKFIDNIGLFKQPDYKLFEQTSDLNYVSLSNQFGLEFVVQFIYGHSGSSTFFIQSEEELSHLKEKYPLRKGKVSRLIHGPTYTVNACITKIGVTVGGLSEQITGISELTSSKGGTVGNDFSQRHLNDSLRTEIISKTMEFGEILRCEGYRGIFGLDFIIEENSYDIYLVEANIRQVASCSYVSYLQRLNKTVPIMLWHILELLDFDFEDHFSCLNKKDEDWINNEITKFRLSNDKIGYNVNSNLPINASQIFFRNTNDHEVQILDQFPSGIYRIRGRTPEESSLLENDQEYMAVYRLREDGWSTLCLEERGYNIMQAYKLGGFLISCVPEKSNVEVLGEIGRIQVLESAFGTKNDKYLVGWIMDVVKCIYENIRIVKKFK